MNSDSNRSVKLPRFTCLLKNCSLLLAHCSLIFCLCSCQAQQQRHSTIDFYEGLKKVQADSKTEAAAYFEKALDSPNIHIAAAASLELMSLRYSGAAIKPETISKIRKKAPSMIASKASGSWAMALDALGTGIQGDPGPDKEKVLALALNNESRSPDEAIQYLLLELRAADSDNINIFSNAENAAIAGRIAVSRSRYREALVFFRMVMADSPGLFFQYPELLSDLGRSYQYTATASPSANGREGIDLFLQWEKNYDEKKYSIKEENLSALIRFRLLFYAARMARQRGFPESVELFERALPWALSLDPKISGATISGEQTDACIWYILNTSLTQDSGRTIRYLEKYIVHWRDDGYYLDVMDKLARGLLLKRQWPDLINIFAITKNRKGIVGAKFAWIIGRAIQEGLLSPRETELAVKALGVAPSGVAPLGAQQQDGYTSDSLAEAYLRIAYNAAAPAQGASAPFDGKALYYRSLSAAALAEPFLTLPAAAEPSTPAATQPLATTEQPKAEAKKPTAKTQAQAADESDAMEFLLGFFRNGAVKFASRYIRMMESDLSPDELRRLAEALGNEKLYQESMRIVSLYMKRDSYQPVRRDLELMYPRPFNEQVTQYARETGIGSAKLYALIRTESAFNPDAISRSGAIGLTQLMPATAEETAARILRRGGPDYRKTDKDSAGGTGGAAFGGDENSGDTDSNANYGDAAANSGAAGGGLIASEVGIDLLEPGANIHMGAAYLAWLEERMGDPLLAILAYNGGMNRVRRWRNSIPAKFPSDIFLETVEYAETMDYGRAVIGAAAMYRVLY